MPPTDLAVTSRFEKLSVPVKLLTAGSAACFADFASFPLDTAKVRLQIQEVKVPLTSTATAANGVVLGVQPNVVTGAHYRGIVGTIATITREEGFRCLYNGLNAGLQRQMCFASVRLGMYEPVKAFYQNLLKLDQSHRGGFLDVSCRIMAGLTTGGMAVSVAQPTDVVKIRFQAQMKSNLSPGQATGVRYTGTWQAYKTIFRTEGMAGLWRGVLPNIGRNAIVNVAEIVCYDIVKENIIVHGLMKDNIPCHFTSAVVAGFCATLCASPVDVIKTRYMNSTPGKYRGAVDCAIKTFKVEGSSAFYKGFWPSFTRIVSWNIIMWISYEQLKRVVVQQYNKDD